MPVGGFDSGDEAFKELTRRTGSAAYETVVNTDDDRASSLLMLLLIGLFAFGGSEAVKLTLRRNFGKGGVNLFKAGIASFGFLLIAYFVYKDAQEGLPVSYGSESSLMFTAIFYAALAALVFFRAILASGSQKQFYPDNKGQSLLSFLLGKNTNPSTIRSFYEPFLFFSLGMFFLQFSYWLSLPLIFCAISAMISPVAERAFAARSSLSRSQEANYQRSSGRKSAK